MYEYLIRPLLFQFDPETAHKIAITTLKIVKHTPGLVQLLKVLMHQQNPSNCMGLTFPNKVGLAAGLDKNGEVANVFSALGFGFVEIGTVTPLGQPGNPKPRLYRIPADKALINRMGFNNQGLSIISKRLNDYKNRTFILGGNIGKNSSTDNQNAINDYQNVLEGLYDSVDYVVLNVSCPNILNLSQLQNKDYLSVIMSMMADFRNSKLIKKPLVLKISPDLTEIQLHESLELVSSFNFNGIIYSNTTTSRDNLSISNKEIQLIGNGGLSGCPLYTKNLEKLAFVRKHIPNNVALIGCGGVFSADDAKRMLDNGADLIQIYTSFIYKGTKIVSQISNL